MPYSNIFWIILSYCLGSIPFGYLISLFLGRNIGWQKTSGATNVFKNIGKWQGVLTCILDVAKGYLAVYGARKLGFSLDIQVFSGVAAIIGHNWSIFLKFGGGRGVATFIGALLALSPQIFFYSIIPLIAITFVWEAGISTVVCLITAIALSFYLRQFGGPGFFALLSFAPIFLKRLYPVADIAAPFNREKMKLLRNRLLFGNDHILEFRIKKVLKRLFHS